MKKSTTSQYEEITSYQDDKILADKVNDTVGSGRFILTQSIFLILYVL